MSVLFVILCIYIVSTTANVNDLLLTTQCQAYFDIVVTTPEPIVSLDNDIQQPMIPIETSNPFPWYSIMAVGVLIIVFGLVQLNCKKQKTHTYTPIEAIHIRTDQLIVPKEWTS